jgi:pimeloyl-ACP methyl ester carboxylesterase
MLVVIALRRVCWIALLIGALAIGISGVVLSETALHPARRLVAPNRDAQTVQVIAQDGVQLRAWLFRADRSNGDAILILHGIADSRGSQLGLARMFLAHGYTVLVPDSRAHGESGGEIATYGLLEADDVHRWVSWLMDEEHPLRVFGLGESLGGAVLIQSLTVEQRFNAIVADSAYSSFERIAQDRVAARLPFSPQAGRLLAEPAIWAGFLYARLRYGLDFRQASPEKALARSTHTPVLLIHGLYDRLTPPEHSRILAASNPRDTTLWLVPGAGHTGAFGAEPVEFERRVLDFYQNLPSGIEVRDAKP